MQIALFGANSSISQAVKPLFEKVSNVMTIGRSNADIILDLNNYPSEFNLPPDIDALIHTAAHFGGLNVDEISDAVMVNVIGTLKLYDASVRAGINQFIYISSIYSHLKADSPLYGIYSISKKYAEEILRLHSKNKPTKLTILRPSQIYGGFESNRIHQPFFYSIIDKIRKNELVTFYGKHDPQRNFIHIDDLAEIIYQVVIKGVEGDFDCAFPENITFAGIADAARSVFQSESEILFDRDKPDLADINIKYDHNLYEILNFQPKITMLEGMRSLKYKNKV
ncbi:MAG: NAD(P)-dependent oxidoreductase [Flavobacterium sp.]|nr:MAG: NAD(P)-dependent oxidoreductase [Flavobacterium sp.]